MNEKILLQVAEHAKKFNYKFSESEIEELVALYEMNNDAYDEATLSLHIENFAQRNTSRGNSDWMHKRRQSVTARRVCLNDFELPAFVKTEETFNFLYSMLGSDIPFSFLCPSQKNKLVASMYPLIVEAGTVLIQQGDVGAEMYIVEDGELDVIINGKLANKLFSASKFGELALLHEIPRTATVKAVRRSKVWAAEQTNFSCIRIRDNLYKKGLVRETLESCKDIPILSEGPTSLKQAISIARFKIFLAETEVRLEPEEILIVFKDAKIRQIAPMQVYKKDIIRFNFATITDLECAIIDLKRIKK